MKISIIGSGNMARGVAMRGVAGGYGVMIHAHDRAKGQALAEAIREHHPDAKVEAAAHDQPLEDVVFLAVPHGSVKDVAHQHKGQWAGKTVVDLTNPIDFSTMSLATEHNQNGAEAVAGLLEGAAVVKAFNTIFASTLASGTVAGRPLDVFLAGNEPAAIQAVGEFAEAAGLRPLVVGELKDAGLLEGMALVHIRLQQPLNGGFATAVKIIS